MTYIKSNNIKVYPSGYRGTTTEHSTISYNPESKLNTETNAKRAMTNLIRYNNYDTYYKGKGDFVITEGYTWSGIPKPEEGTSERAYSNFEFFINGYYIRIIDSYLAFKDIINENPNAIYAKVGFAIANAKEPQSTTDGDEGTIAIVDTANNYITDKHLANLETGSNAGVVLTPSNTNDDALGTIIDFSSLDQNIDSKDCFTGLSLEITPSTSDGYHYFKILEKEDNDYIVPSQSKFILNPQNVFGGTDGNVDKPLKEYLSTNKIWTNSLYLDGEKTENFYPGYGNPDTEDYQNIIINKYTGKLCGHSTVNPYYITNNDISYCSSKFVSRIEQNSIGQTRYTMTRLPKATQDTEGLIKGADTGYHINPTSGQGTHYVRIDNTHDSDGSFGYVDDIRDGVVAKSAMSSSIKYYLWCNNNLSGNDLDAITHNEFYIKDACLYAKEINCQNRITANNFYANSDKRLKENLETFNYGPSILDLPIYRYDYIDGPKNQIGCLAQDLHELYPELVREDKDCYLSIQENKLVYLLIEEVKRLTKRVEKLEKKSK